MKKFASLIFILLLFVQVSSASVISTVNDSVQLQSVIKTFEERHQLNFYYKQQWVDSIYVIDCSNQTFSDSLLTVILDPTNLQFYKQGNTYYLLYKQTINDQPSLLDHQTNTTTPKGLIFTREYSNINDSNEDRVYEIGDRSLMKNNPRSSIAGYVKNDETNEPVEGAIIYDENTMTTALSDDAGFFTITLPVGRNRLSCQYYGLKTQNKRIVLFSDGQLNFTLEVDVIALQEITIESEREANIATPQMGIERIKVEEVKKVPVVLGESDIMKIATTKAGIQTIGEGASGYNVRGGKTDQNLILIDGSPIYNASHFFGFFSVFNSYAIENMEAYKSFIPARYGSRLSSVFDVETKLAGKEQFKGKGGISPVSGKLVLEIPIIKNKTSLMIAGRKTYSNWILSRSKNADFSENKVSFGDLTINLHSTLNDKNEIQLSAYHSMDEFRLNSDTLFSFSNFGFTNWAGSFNYRHKFNEFLTGSLRYNFARYNYDLSYEESIVNGFSQFFGLDQHNFSANSTYYINDENKFEFGLDTKLYLINPGEKEPNDENSLILHQKLNQEIGLENGLYLSNQQELGWGISTDLGLRYSLFSQLSPSFNLIYQPGLPKNNETIIDTLNQATGVIEMYHGPEWRLSAKKLLTKTSSIKLGITRTRQYLHGMTNSASLSPTDIWRISSLNLKPQIADMASVGYFRNLMSNSIELGVETYYKRYQNLIDFKIGGTYLMNQHVEQDVLQGPGKSYGVEFSIHKTGKLNGWLNYTYSRTMIKLDGQYPEEIINRGEYFPALQDKPHSINLVSSLELTRRVNITMNCNYSTGRPVTFPVTTFKYKGTTHIHFADRNSFRIPDYFRLDLGVNLEGNHKLKKLSHSYWSLFLYNVTGRDNAYSVFLDVRQGQVVASKLVVFGNMIPTLSYNFEF